ncbi:hypothetical protein [Nakamurella panacisegetis]|nr:hypothetical protein [Nakamurella panacisegetis]
MGIVGILAGRYGVVGVTGGNQTGRQRPRLSTVDDGRSGRDDRRV